MISASDEILRKLAKKNKDIVYAGRKVVLTTYEERHVKKYHSWMQDEEIQAQTASEPMTLEEEYQTRKEWRAHDEKGTFLIMDRSIFEETDGDEDIALVGDVNFVQYPDFVEVMIMVAEPSARRKGIGREAMLLMLRHIVKILDGHADLNVTANISSSNTRSQNFFVSLGFVEADRNEVFQEVAFVLQHGALKESARNVELVYENEELVDAILQVARKRRACFESDHK